MLEIFKIFYKKNDEIEKIYVFGKKNDLKDVEREKLEKKGKVEYINSYIHPDDTVMTVKQKIFYFLKKQIPIDEMYLFSKKKETLSPEKVFNDLTQNGSVNLDAQKINNYFINLDNGTMKLEEEDKEEYLFEDFKTKLKEREYVVDIPLGFKFIIKKKLLNTVDPYEFVTIDNLLKYNFEYTFSGENNKLLFEYGDLIDNTIYLTYAEDVLSHHRTNERDIIKSYFPNLYNDYLRKDNQITFQDIKKNRNEKLIKDNKIKNFYDDKQNEKVDLFYELNDNKSNDNETNDNGIKKIMFTIHQDMKMKIPLETIFKLIKTSEKVPLIKYNPGNRRENIYRLYTNKISTDGKKIPYLYNFKKKKNEIIKIGQALATKKKLGFYIRHKVKVKEKDKLIHIFCELLENSLMEVHINFDNGKKIKDIEEIINNTINKEILEPIYTYFQDSGHKYYKFESFDHPNIEINNIDYIFKIKNEKGIDLKNYINLISNIFEVSQSLLTSNKSISMRYKKISYYNKMNGINSFIIEQMQVGKDSEYILKLLIDNYNLSMIEAKGYIAAILNEIKVQVGVYENKKIFRDHPGFPIEIFQTTELIKDKYENMNIVKINKINNIKYIKYIKMYIGSLFKIILQEINDDNKKKIERMNNIKEISIKQEKDNIAIVEKEFSKRSSVSIEDNKLELSDDDSSDDDFLDGLGFGGLSDDDEENSLKISNNEKGSSDESHNLDNIDLSNDEGDDDNIVGTLTKGKSKGKSKQKTEKLEKIDLNNIKLKGSKSFFIKRLRARDPGLFSNNDQDENFQAYTKACQSQYMKQPIALTDEEKKAIDEKDNDAGIKSYDEHITYGSSDKNKNHYICPRFWCLRDDDNGGMQRSLSVKQVNDGACGGWDAVIPWEKDKMKEHGDMVPPGKRIIEINSERMNLLNHYDKIKKDNETAPGADGKGLLSKIVYKPYIPNFQTKKGDKMCLPCCFKKASYDADEEKKYSLVDKRSDEQKKSKEDQHYKYMYEPSSKMPKCKENKKCMDEKGKVIWKNIVGEKTKRGFSIKNSYQRNGKTKKKPEGAQQKAYEKCDAKPKNNNIKDEYFERRQKEDNEAKIEANDSPGEESDDSNVNENPLTVAFPLQNKQLGYLLPQISKFLQYNVVNKCYISINDTGLKSNTYCLLRKGVERKKNQTFLSCIANLYNDISNHSKNSKKERTIVEDVITVNQLKKNILDNLNIDKFISYHNGNLIKLFETKDNIKPSNDSMDQIKNSTFYSNIEKSLKTTKTKEEIKSKINKIVSAYENYKNFINNNSETIDYKYLWDILCLPSKEGGLFPNGMNLIILDSPNDDVTGKIQLICPTNAYTNTLFDPEKLSVILYSMNNIYEPLFWFNKLNKKKGKKNLYKIIKAFNSDNLRQISPGLKDILNFTMEQCKPFVKSTTSDFQNNIKLDTLLDYIGDKSIYKVEKQIVNFNLKVIGIVISDNNTNKIFLPCRPSNIKVDLDYGYFDEIPMMEYSKTIVLLNKIKNHNKKILCKPKKKVIDATGFIIGIITETNQFVKVVPNTHINNITDGSDDGLGEIKNIADKTQDFIKLDNQLIISKKFDKKRQTIANKIKLESNFYNMFRGIFRNVINKNGNLKFKKEIKKIIKENSIYRYKIQNIREVIRELMDPKIKWTKSKIFDNDIEIKDMVKCLGLKDSDCGKKEFCSFSTQTDKCQIFLPEDNLFFTEVKNDTMYYLKLADELIRYPRLNKFILNPRTFLNYREINYNLHDNEIILLGVLLRDEYFNNIKLQKNSDFVNQKNIYDIVNPIDNHNNNIFNLDYIKRTKENVQVPKEKVEAKVEEKVEAKVEAKVENKEKVNEDDFNKLWNVSTCKRNVDFQNKNDQKKGGNLHFITNEILSEKDDNIFRRDFYKPTKQCSFEIIKNIIFLHTNKKIDDDELKEILINKMTSMKNNNITYRNVHMVIRSEKKFSKKKELMKTRDENVIKDCIDIDDYYLTWYDYMILASHYKIPLICFNSSHKSKIKMKTGVVPYTVINKSSNYYYVLIGNNVRIESGKTIPYKPNYCLLKYNGLRRINKKNIIKFDEMVKNNSYKNVDDYFNNILTKPKIIIKMKENK